MKQTIWHPNLILGLVSFFTLILSVGMRANRMNSVGDVLFGTTLLIGLIHWTWSIIDVLKHYRANQGTEDRTIIWVIFVIIVPPLGGLLYYAFRRNLGLQ